MQDVVPPQDPQRSIRNIPVPAGRRHFDAVPQEYLPSSGGGRRHSFYLWAAAVVVAFVLIGMLVSTLFAGATVVVYPRQASVTAPGTLTATLDAPVGSLAYKRMSVSAIAERTVSANGTQQVDSPAQGTVTIFNAYNTSPQQLIATTRFEAPDGKIYRLKNAVTVPGGKKSGSTLTPGSVTATVVADKPGAAYNRTNATKFTIPGFKGSPKYTTFYATADSITGGASGAQPAVSPADRENAQGQMQQELLQSLPAKAAAEIPEGYVAVPGTVKIEYADIVSADAGGGKAKLTQSASATQAIIRSADLANALAKSSIQGYSGEAVDFADITQISMSVATGTPYSAGSTSFPLGLSGTATILWQFDSVAIENALAGKNRGEFDSIIKGFAPAVSKATATLKPFWKTTFPANITEIKVVRGKIN